MILSLGKGIIKPERLELSSIRSSGKNEAIKNRRSLKGFFGKIGPGFITGAADDDPSGIGTYAQTGAIFGFSQLWLVWFTCPFMIVIQQMCARIGIVTGKGLAGVILDNYSKKVLYITVLLLVVANTINIGADLGAMASSAQMLLGLPHSFWLILITGSIIILEIFVPYINLFEDPKISGFDSFFIYFGCFCCQTRLGYYFLRKAYPKPQLFNRLPA